MKQMSLSGRALWHSWVISASLIATLVSALMTAMIMLGGMVTQSDASIIFVALELYALSTIFFG